MPTGFAETLVTGGLSAPTAMQFAPDGRLFVCEQAGTLRVIKNGALLPTPFVTLTVSSIGERGLLGVAFDPAFAVNQFVYVHYTATTPTIHNRISRFTANGDVAVGGSEFAILDLPTLGATNHNGGALAFGADGKLYAAVGENAVASNSQSMTTLLGKMLRLNTDGTIPSDNPFYASATGQNRAIWALGLRNPFTFAFDRAGTQMFINDVGEITYEEIDEGIAGSNYGWPNTEGPTSDPMFRSPRYWYGRSDGCAITGGAFYTPLANQFPADYIHDYFFADYCNGWIKRLDPAAGNSVVPFASGISLPVDLKVADDGSLYYLARGTGAVYRITWIGGTVTADSVTPAFGTGASQIFALQFSDTAGATDLATAWVWFNAAFAASSASSCLAYYNRPANTVFLLNDAGSQYVSGVVGAPGMLQNSQCAITLGGGTTVTSSGTTLTLNLAMTFAPIFAGSKNVYLYAASAGGASSGWQIRGAWTVPIGPVPVVTADGVTPASGTGTSQMFALQFSDTAGATDLATAWVWFNATFASSSASSCLAYYDRAANTVSLLNDAGTMWMAAMVGSSGTLQNSQCVITLGGSTTVALSGDTLTVNLAMTFAPMFAGAKNVYLYAANAGGSSSGWQTRGAWTVPTGPVPVVTADGVTPASGTGASQMFALQFSDTAGATDLATAWVWFNATFASSSASSCLAYYNRPANTVFLLNDAGSQYVSGVVGAPGTLQNSQCAIALGGSTTATVIGTTLTLNLAVIFQAAFAGTKNIYMYANGSSGAASGWQTRGTWTVSGGVVVTADSVTPSSGSGATQTFALQYSDTAGLSDLATMWVWFNATFAPTSANSCLAYYQTSTQLVFLLNDAGTAWISGPRGSAGTLQNSQCTIQLAATTLMGTGNTLTLNLAVIFQAAFAGTKDIYMYANGHSGAASGWQTRGTWTVSGGVVVTADSVTPSSGSGATQTFALQYSDTAGLSDLATMWVWVNATFAPTSANSCLAYYQTATQTLFLLNDAGTAWLSNTIPNAGTLQNSACTIDLNNSFAFGSGNTFTLNLAVTFSSSYSGGKIIFMYAGGNSGVNSGWQDRGDWTVP